MTPKSENVQATILSELSLLLLVLQGQSVDIYAQTDSEAVGNLCHM